MKSDQTHVAFLETDRASTGAREMRPLHDLSSYLREYARERPEVVALTCFTAGFILGWRLKPW
jgi:hypothetical protein